MRRWPGRTITYTESIPGKWDWSLERALKAWNSAGNTSPWLKAKKGRQAQLVIGYGDTRAPTATPAVVRLPAPSCTSTPATGTPRTPGAQGLGGPPVRPRARPCRGVPAHRREVRADGPVFDWRLPLLDKAPGYYACRWIDKPLLKRFVAAYGGRAKQAPQKCLIDPLPASSATLSSPAGRVAR